MPLTTNFRNPRPRFFSWIRHMTLLKTGRSLFPQINDMRYIQSHSRNCDTHFYSHPAFAFPFLCLLFWRLLSSPSSALCMQLGKSLSKLDATKKKETGFVVPILFSSWYLMLSQTFNSLGQSPCVVAAALAVCNGRRSESGLTVCWKWLMIAVYAVFKLPALPPDFVYYGPSNYTTEGDVDCICNTVFYSLLSACAYCQGRDWIPYVFLWFVRFNHFSLQLHFSWSLYLSNCSRAVEDGV